MAASAYCALIMIISAPPMAAAFFQGTLGQLNAYSPFGHIKPEPQGGRGGYGPPGSPSYVPPTSSADEARDGRSAPNTVFNNQGLGTASASANPQRDEMKQKGDFV